MSVAEPAGQERILITGATSAIGGELALYYAKPGTELILHGRNAAILEPLAERCRQAGAQVQTHQLDLRDLDALHGWLSQCAAFDLVIVNAGMNIHVGPNGEPEAWEDTELLLDINVKATLRVVQSVLPAMRARGRGQIALMSSLAAYFGLPTTPTYSASKAAVKAYGEGLRGWLAPEGIKINVVMPGYVSSPMCDAMPGPKPFLWAPQRAAQRIARGLKANKARISFPFPLNLGCWFLTVLPAPVSVFILSKIGYDA